jgi:hypothetical protein
MATKPSEPQPLQIITNDEFSRGRYSNLMLVAHSPEDFILDWVLQAPNGQHLVARIIVSPGHMKRIVKTLNENLAKFESNFGEIKMIEPPVPRVN